MRLKKSDYVAIQQADIPPLMLQKVDYKHFAVCNSGRLGLIERFGYKNVSINNYLNVSDRWSLRINRWVVTIFQDDSNLYLDCYSIDEKIPEISKILNEPIPIPIANVDVEHLVLDDSTVAQSLK